MEGGAVPRSKVRGREVGALVRKGGLWEAVRGPERELDAGSREMGDGTRA